MLNEVNRKHSPVKNRLKKKQEQSHNFERGNHSRYNLQDRSPWVNKSGVNSWAEWQENHFLPRKTQPFHPEQPGELLIWKNQLMSQNCLLSIFSLQEIPLSEVS